MMQRLYFRIYLAVLGSLVLFAVLAGVTWRLFAGFEGSGPSHAFYVEVAQGLAPPASASPDVQRVRIPVITTGAA